MAKKTRRPETDPNKKYNGDDDVKALLYDMEFKWKDDDAWYTVKIDLSDDDHTLTVKFLGFSDYWDVKYTSGEFLSEAQLDELSNLFRPVSKQVQDNECSNVHPGMTVCAAYSTAADDLRYYDAVIEAVHHETHSFKNGEEECPCTFVLCWTHGPKRGNLTLTSIVNICTLVSTSQVDPKIASFFKRAKEKMNTNSKGRCFLPEISASALSGSLCSTDAICSPLGLSTSESIVTDEDMGGDDLIRFVGPCYFLIENLESDLTPSSINHFIREHTSVSPEAYVFPRLSSVPCSTAAIVLDSRAELKKVYEFLANPRHLIVSLRGRPWVLIEQELRHGTFGPTRGSLAIEYRDENQKGNELKFVQSGTDTYKKAMERKSMFMELLRHEQTLYQRLALKESRFFGSS